MLYKHELTASHYGQKNYQWETAHLPPFDELIISWNAQRPLKGQYVILASVYIEDHWSPWLLYAVWGDRYQYSFEEKSSKMPVRCVQDQIEILAGKVATGFRLCVKAYGEANLQDFYRFYCCASLLQQPLPSFFLPTLPFIHLDVSGLSQLNLRHPRATSFCSPTSTTAALRFILSRSDLNPVSFTEKVYDAGFDIYGHWPFNVAQAFVTLGPQGHCWCERVTGFEAIVPYLQKGLPVVVSVKGHLTGSLMPYTNGHLIVVKGYDPHTQRVLCMDPAFPSDVDTHQAYSFEEFMQAWRNRRYLSYLFHKC